ncbi:MAG TPA: 50S ribosomal protein L24 [Polyangiaceae bacterium]|nr:50S ribosomal protein L24 [Polyangiaceae bacterium]
MERLHRGDLVRVTSGNDKGKQGRVKRVLTERGAVIVEGVNMVKRHVKATAQRAGGILEVEAPLHASKVMPVDPQTGKPTRVRVRIEGEKKVRVAKSGATIESQQG